VTSAEVSPLLSTTSILLAAFGFLYNSWRDEVAKALLPTSFEVPSLIEGQIRSVKNARNSKAVPLAIGSVVVAVLLAPPFVTALGDLVNDGYEALKAAFVLMEGFWIFVAGSRIWVVWELQSRLRGLKQNLSEKRSGSG